MNESASETFFTVTPDRIILCFAVALVTVMAVRFALGRYHDVWFKRSIPKSLVTLRTKLQCWLALGYPVCREGYIVTGALLFAIALECFVIFAV